MRAPTKNEIVVARFIFSDAINPQFPSISNTRDKANIAPAPTNFSREWITRVINREKTSLAPGHVLRYSDYKVLCGDIEIFRLGDSIYDKIILVMTGNYTYWLFFQVNPRDNPLDLIYGRAGLDISFCPCCFKFQYHRIIKAVKDVIALRRPVVV